MQRAFVIRPFGTKKDTAGTGIDFEQIHTKLIGPALKKAGFEGGTTGEIVEAGNIHEDVKQAVVQIEVYDAHLSDGETAIEKPKERLAPVAVEPELIARIKGLSDGDLLAVGALDAEVDRLSRRREAVLEARDATVRKIAAVVHERMAFSVSVCVLVILGAALGIALRGSHVLTAFGISFVPMLLVIVTIVMGKQLAQNPGTTWQGLLLMWSGIAVVALLDLWTLTRVVRR